MSFPLDWPTPLGLGIGAVEVEGMALPIIPFPLLIGEGSGVKHTLVLGVELNSEITTQIRSNSIRATCLVHYRC